MLGQAGPMLSHLGLMLGPCWAIGPILDLYGCESKRFGIEQVLVDIPFNTPFNTLLNRRVPIVQYPPFNTPFNTLVQLVYLPFSFVLVVISRVAENSIEAKRMIGKIQNDLFHLLAYSTHTVILSATGSATGFLR